MELFKILLYTHIFLGGVALIAGFIAASIIKGSKWHKKMGTIFHNSILGSIVVSLIISCLLEHYNPFLFCIGVFSAYSVISGKRCLKSNSPNFRLKIDFYLAYSIIIIGISMIGIGFYLRGDFQTILSVFGILAIISGLADYKKFQNFEKYKSERIEQHIKKITGGYVAAVTAFIVVNGFFPGLWAWFLPTILGGIYASYYVIIEKRKRANNN